VKGAAKSVLDIITFASAATPNVRQGAFATMDGSDTVADPKPKPPDNRPPQLRKPRGPKRPPRAVFLANHDGIVKALKSAFRRAIKLGNPRWNEYTTEEAARIVAAVRGYTAELERAFKGMPKEKGLFDL